ncbi:MAG: acylneuraminate cytidylyltransferase [Chloroflexota bacterium]|nr:acylneuraminate cytidylyltransferase [Chloroflexota bacterium]
MKNNAIAIIPARGGSKGIPRKNVRLLHGKPLIAHTIEHAYQARSVDRVVVSTDDPEVRSISESNGAEVVLRPAEISGDTVSSECALLHVLEQLRQTEGYEPELVVFLQCTSPLTLPEDIDGTVEALLSQNADSAFTVTPFHRFLWKQTIDGETIGINHDSRERLLRQERGEQFLENGGVYVMRANGFKEAKHRFFGKIAMYVVPANRTVEIDESLDLCIAEIMMQDWQRKQQVTRLPYQIAAVIFDFDGVFTDNKVFVLQDGREAVACDRSDGWGIAELKKMGKALLVLSTEENPVVNARCYKLGVDCLHGISDKRGTLMSWLAERNLDPAQVVYVGNDVNDLGCMQSVGCAIAVCDAHPKVQSAAQIVLSTPGGRGAVREVAALIEQRMEGCRSASRD